MKPKPLDLTDRDIRQRGIVPPDKLKDIAAIIAGVGAGGRQVALQLAAVGVPKICLVDFDSVEVANMAAQGYWPTDFGKTKVKATGDLCRCINPDIDITEICDKFTKSTIKELQDTRWLAHHDKIVLFSCVDTMSARRFIFENRGPISLWVDARMSAEVIRVIVNVPYIHTEEEYTSTLFSDKEAYQDSCTARTTIFTASISAALMIEQFTKYLRGLPVEMDFDINLLTLEMSVQQ